MFFSIGIHAALLVFLAVTTISGAAQKEKGPELPMTLSLFNFVEEKPSAPAPPQPPAKPSRPQPAHDETAVENFIAADELPEAAGSDAVDDSVENTADNTSMSSAALESGSKQTGEYVQKNYRYIQRRIQDCLTYPAQARRAGIQGTAEIIFTIGQDGSVSGLAVRRTSGEAMLDEAALEAVRKAAPFSPPPAPARIVIPVAFNIK